MSGGPIADEGGPPPEAAPGQAAEGAPAQPTESASAPTTESAPALAAEALALGIDGRVALSGLDFVTRGDRVLLVGDWSPIVAAVGLGDATVRRGRLAVMGHPLGSHHAICGVAPHVLPLPPKTTLRAYLTLAARLRGHGRGAARARADAVIARLGLGALATRHVAGASWPEQKAVFVAQALVHDPALLVIEAPFAGLDPGAAAAMLSLLGRATEGRHAVIVVPRLEAEGAVQALASRATDLVALHDGAIALHARPDDLAGGAALFAVTVVDGGEALKAHLEAGGAEVIGADGRFTVRFSTAAAASEILAAARATDAAVIGCEPIFRR